MSDIKKLDYSFYERNDVVRIAKDLLGKILVTDFNHQFTSGRIVETEAYAGVTDRASHAYGGRRTGRTEVMFSKSATAYVYLCYGIHNMFNIVTNKENIPHAILVRAVEPIDGIDIMLRRTGKQKPDHTLTRGPGNVARAFGFDVNHSGWSLTGEQIYIAEDGLPDQAKNAIIRTPRIGVDYAGADASLPYRFILAGNKFLSGNKRQNELDQINPNQVKTADR